MEKKQSTYIKHIKNDAKQYTKPTLVAIGTVKEKTAGGQINQPVDGSGWANKNTAS